MMKNTRTCVVFDPWDCEEPEKRAYFHKWVEVRHDNYDGLCTMGLVEFRNGTIRYINPRNITFTDRYREKCKLKQTTEKIRNEIQKCKGD